jgi:hypothetical protein
MIELNCQSLNFRLGLTIIKIVSKILVEFPHPCYFIFFVILSHVLINVCS